MNVDGIDTCSPGAVVNFQRLDGSIVCAKILGPSERGADYQPITHECTGTIVTHDCAPVARRKDTPTTHLSSHNGQLGGEKANWEEGAIEVERFFAPLIPRSY